MHATLDAPAFESHPSRCMERLSPAAGHGSIAPAYERHRPEETVLYGVVQSELESFLARGRDRPLPRFVEREFRGFLECGILAHGFLRVHCDACGRDRIVAFSFKGRGYAECWNMLSGRRSEGATPWDAELLGRSGSATTSHILQPLSDAISSSGGRNLPGRSWGGVTDVKTPIRCVTSTRR